VSPTRLAAALSLLLVPATLAAEEPPKKPELDGPTVVLKDALLDNLVGEWTATGKVMGRPLRHRLRAEYVLNHQFLKLHFEDLEEPAKGDTRYEAMVFLGYDNLSERYVAHWIDVFGGRFSETLGYGKREPDAVALVFEYPDGPFHTTFRWAPKTATWSITMRQKSAAGAWETFSEQSLARPAAKKQP